MAKVETHMLCTSLELILSHNFSIGTPSTLFQIEVKQREANHLTGDAYGGPPVESHHSLLACYYYTSYMGEVYCNM